MKIFFSILAFFIISGFTNPTCNSNTTKVSVSKPSAEFKLGNEVLLTEKLDLLGDKHIGIITNQSGVTSAGNHIIDELKSKANVIKIFSPEHGFRGDDNTGNFTDAQTGISVVSLYGNKKKPAAEDLKDVDILVYDIQDVGARFYTYINTLYYCMESAMSSGKKFIVCDRPIMINPNYVDGFMLESDCKSFVGLLDIPIAYGLTCGELSNFINDNYYEGKVELEVVKMENYSRNRYEALNLKWVNPSPSIYFPSSALCYTGTCLFEGTNFAEGRGSDKPFEYVGAPYCDADKLINELAQYNFPDVQFNKITFTPTAISSPSNPPKYVGEKCEGIIIDFRTPKTFVPVKISIAILVSLKKLFPEFSWRKDNYIDKLAGTKSLRTMIDNGASYQEIVESYQKNLDVFKSLREKYIIYR